MTNAGSPFDLRYNNQTIEPVVEFKYFGSTIRNFRIVSARSPAKNLPGKKKFTSLRKLSQIWHIQKYSLRLKLRLFNSSILSTLYYGSGTSQIDQILEKELLAFENMCLRHILNIHWSQKVTNATIRQKTSQTLVTKVIKNRKSRCFGHVICVPKPRLT